MSKMNPTVSHYLSKAKKWKEEMEMLRAILLQCSLEETLKWGKPCYCYESNNIVMIQAFKEHFDLGFFKGALLKDTKSVLVKAGENTQAGRQLRFTNIKEIEKATTLIKQYVKEAVEVEKKGTKLVAENKIEIIDELKLTFKKNAPLKKAFENLTPGRQRAYLIYFSAAKQSETRYSRIENNIQKIMCGKGMNDCTCGLSKRMPNCDGSHKILKSK
jgi:uncharacterized protein YdeI (YjbR/CyaY-like superfamily)